MGIEGYEIVLSENLLSMIFDKLKNKASIRRLGEDN